MTSPDTSAKSKLQGWRPLRRLRHTQTARCGQVRQGASNNVSYWSFWHVPRKVAKVRTSNVDSEVGLVVARTRATATGRTLAGAHSASPRSDTFVLAMVDVQVYIVAHAVLDPPLLPLARTRHARPMQYRSSSSSSRSSSSTLCIWVGLITGLLRHVHCPT
jgi:hypothetical protein